MILPLTLAAFFLPFVNAGWTLTYGFDGHVIKGNGNTECIPLTNFVAGEDFTWSVSGLSSMFCCLTLYVDSSCARQLLQACSSETETVYENVESYKVGGCVAVTTSSVASTLNVTSMGTVIPTAP